MRENDLLTAGFGTLVLAGPLSLHLWRTHRRCAAAHSWRRVRCRVKSATVLSQTMSQYRKIFTIDVRFVYEIDGKSYEGKRYDFSKGPFRRDAAYRIVEGLPAGAETECLVNPERHSEAALRAGGQERTLFGLRFVLAFLLMSLGMIGYGLWGKLT